MTPKYTIDASSINDFLQLDRAYDKEVFESPWKYIDQCCESGEIISHIEVHEEIMLGGIDRVVKWARMKNNFFKGYDLPSEADLITTIGEKYPLFLYQKKDISVHADPWLIAQASINKLIIITSEKPDNHRNIPYVANQFGVETVGIVTFFKQRGIKI